MIKASRGKSKVYPRGSSDSKSMALICSSLKDSTASIQIYIGISKNNLLIKCSFKRKKERIYAHGKKIRWYRKV